MGVAMNSRAIVHRTLDYEQPERLARSFGDSDFVWTGHSVKTHATKWKEVGGGRWERIDEWGNLWGRVDATSKGEVAKGVLQSVDDIAGYEFPDFSDAADYEGVAKARSEAADRWLIGGVPGFAFNIARKLFRLEDYLVFLLTDLDALHGLHDRIDVLVQDMIRNYAAGGVDSIMFPEDWGTQDALMINPGLWREEFFPRFRANCDLARELGIRVFMHSCGQTEEIVPGLMEAGVSLLQFDQPELHGIDNLASHQERGRMTFWCPVDIQKTLQTRDEERIRSAAREMVDKLWQGRGGFVAGYYGDNASIGLEPSWQEIACDEFLKSGVPERYQRAEAKACVQCPLGSV